jgi:methylated-DNA-[protein]-cysteine S-methyltransferase
LVWEDDALAGLHFVDDRAPSPSGRAPAAIRNAIDDYFAGDLDAIDAIAVRLHGTQFQRQVWTALRDIPVGTTISYKELATRIGRPTATRAVGLANGSNPVAIVVPCHRVIGANGTLTGYGGGLDRKRWLLAHERAAAHLPLATVARVQG